MAYQLREPTSSAFDEVEGTAGGHFALCLYAAIFALLRHLHRLTEAGGADLESIFDRFPFLGEYFSEARACMPEEITWGESAAWWEREMAVWEAACPSWLPLTELSAHHDIGFEGRLTFMAAGLVEEDSRFGTLFDELQKPLGLRRPTLELLGQLASGGGSPGESDSWSVCRPLVDGGFLAVTDPEAPRAEWALRVPPLLWDAARDAIEEHPVRWGRIPPAPSLPTFDKLVQPAEFIKRLMRLPALVESDQAAVIALRSPPGSEPVEALGAVARALDRRIVEVEGRAFVEDEATLLLGPLCTLTRSMPVIGYELGPGESADPPRLGGYTGPMGLILGGEGGLAERATSNVVTISLPAPRVELREVSWRRALGDRPVDDLDTIADRFHLAGGFIRRAADIACAHASLDGRDKVTLADVQHAARSLNHQLLDSLADRLETGGVWADLVCGDATGAKLSELERRCRHRERLLDRLGRGFGTTSNRGVRALFSGASGTGKTLAARILAAELGLDLYRVDLAAVINKYIGETEKNLHRVLTRAEALDVVLLLDEGDALLGSRTEVRSANDRYANLETNYLLQRLEGYDGIVVVTTNLGENIDTAFQRRMDVVVPFLAPQAVERWRILELHLPADHLVDVEFMERTSAACQLTGGQLRNAALHASLLALDNGATAVGTEHLEEAIRSEFRKAGAVYPLAREGFDDGADRVEAFMAALGDR